MINNTGANISMTRGDDVAIHVNIWEVAADGTKTAYELEEGDTLTLTIKHNSDADDTPIIQKVFTGKGLLLMTCCWYRRKARYCPGMCG